MSRRLTITGGAVTVAVALTVLFELGRRSSVARTEREAEGAETRTTEREGESAYEVAEIRPTPPLPYDDTPGWRSVDPTPFAVEFVHPDTGDGVRSSVIVGAPGIWPPETLQSDRQGTAYLPQTGVGTLRGAESNRFELLARSASGRRAHWGTVSFEGSEKGKARTLELREAGDVRATVRTPGGLDEPERAEVRLTRGELGFVTLNKYSGPEGRASFRAIPPGSYVASASVSGVGRGENRFEHDGEGTKAVVIRLDEQPVGQPEAEGAPPASAEEGEAPARRVDVRIRGISDSEWRRTHLRWRPPAGEWQLATLRPTEGGGGRIWRRRVRDGSVELEVRTEGGLVARRSFQLDSESNEFRWKPALHARYRVYTVDPYGTPVEGAAVDVWREGEQVASNVSRGEEPVVFEVESGAPIRLFAAHSRQGETVRRLEPGGGEVTLTLDAPLFSSKFPPGRVRTEAGLREALEVGVVRDAGSWRVEGNDPEARGLRAGLERGDRLVSVRRVSKGWTVLFERNRKLRTIAVDGEPTGE